MAVAQAMAVRTIGIASKKNAARKGRRELRCDEKCGYGAPLPVNGWSMLTAIGAALLVGSGLVSGHRADAFCIRLGLALPRDTFAWLGLASGVLMAMQLPW